MFLGSGFSRRYALTENWKDLLRFICRQYSDNEFLYEKYSNEVDSESEYGRNPAIAKLIDRDFTNYALSSDQFTEFRKVHADEIKSGKSLVK